VLGIGWSMVDAEEIGTRGRRGHDLGPGLGKGWQKCNWCGTWVRQIQTTEEREDEPPEDDQDPFGNSTAGASCFK